MLENFDFFRCRKNIFSELRFVKGIFDVKFRVRSIGWVFRAIPISSYILEHFSKKNDNLDCVFFLGWQFVWTTSISHSIMN